LADLFAALHAQHHRAGRPSLRQMAAEVGCSRTTISAAFSEPRLPRWGLLELIVETLDGDPEQFRSLWLAASAAPPATEAESPMAVTTYVAPHDLPAPVTPYLGRAADLTHLDEALRAAQDGLTPKVLELREADDWQRWANVSVQEQLIGKMEALKALDDAEAIARTPWPRSCRRPPASPPLSTPLRPCRPLPSATACVPCSPIGRRCWCWTTPSPPISCGRCCRAVPPAS
jgi:hypothetical protein